MHGTLYEINNALEKEAETMFYIIFYEETNYVKKEGRFHFSTTNVTEALSFSSLEEAKNYVKQNFHALQDFSYGKVITKDGNRIAGVIHII